MNNQRSFTVLLAIFAILLAVNLVMQFETSAQAETQTNLGPPPVPKVVGGSGLVAGNLQIIRIWDNGDVDISKFNQLAGDCEYVPHCSTQLIGGCNDLNGDGFVDTVDLLELFEDWGACEF